MNVSVLNGYLAKDPYMGKTKSGVPVANFALAHRENRSSTLEIFECVAFGKTALYIEENFWQDDLAIVQGRLTISAWEDRLGAKHHIVKISVSDIEHQGLEYDAEEEEEPEVPLPVQIVAPVLGSVSDGFISAFEDDSRFLRSGS